MRVKRLPHASLPPAAAHACIGAPHFVPVEGSLRVSVAGWRMQRHRVPALGLGPLVRCHGRGPAPGATPVLQHCGLAA